MSVGNRRPREFEQHQEPRRRIGELERRLLRGSAIPAVPPSQSTPPVTFPGNVAAPMTTGLFYCPRDQITYVATRISARVPGSGTCSVDIHLNGSTIATVTLGSGEQTAVFATSFQINDGDYLDMELTAAASQVDVTVQLIEAPS